jgi:hypothetical protein
MDIEKCTKKVKLFGENDTKNMKTKSTTTLRDLSFANIGETYIIMHVCPPNLIKQQRQQTKEPDPVAKCSEDDDSLNLQQLTDTRSTQVYPYELDPGNYSHPKNRSTQTEQIRRSNNGVQTVPCSQSSEASQTASSYFAIPSSGPFITTAKNNICSSTTTSGNSCSNTATKGEPPVLGVDEASTGIRRTRDEATRIGPFSSTSSSSSSSSSSNNSYSLRNGAASKAYLNRLMKAKPDGPIIHGPFYCDCPGGLDFCKQDFF